MAQIFISYDHKDRQHLEKLTHWLLENDFSEREIWYDNHIEGGTNWRDEISTALDSAYAVLVIVTKQSVESLYCTFEWAYAMGQGIPILPLTFDEVSIADVPTPLTSRQFVNCTDGIPEYLKQQLQQMRTTPPQVAAINKEIYDTVYDTHRRYFVLSWCGNELPGLETDESFEIINYFSQQAAKAHSKLQELMVDKAFALSGKQHRYCWQLVDELNYLTYLQYQYTDWNDFINLSERLEKSFNDKWLEAFLYFEDFEERNWRRKKVQSYFDSDLSEDYDRIEAIAEIVRVFPFLFADDAYLLVNNKVVSDKRKKAQQDSE